MVCSTHNYGVYQCSPMTISSNVNDNRDTLQFSNPHHREYYHLNISVIDIVAYTLGHHCFVDIAMQLVSASRCNIL